MLKNYNFAFVFYDISEQESQISKNRATKVFKICKKYFTHHQKSVFKGNITPSNLIKFKDEISQVIDKNCDFLSIIKLLNEHSFEEENLGENKNDTSGLFI